MMKIYDGFKWLTFVAYDNFLDAVLCLDEESKKEIHLFTEDIIAYEDEHGNINGPNILNDTAIFR